MTSEKWRKIEEVYNSLVDLAPDARANALAEVEDASIREEVRQLLEAEPIAPELSGAIQAVAMAAGAGDQHFGPWRATRIIGYGGTGSVYEAFREDGGFGQKAAIKVLHAGRNSSLALERFHQEREILALLNHPYIAHLIDGGETSAGVSYIVMELVEGRPVTEWCETAKPSREEMLRLFLKICAGVEFAHQRLIVHRDLKPGNILVTADGTPKLLDFGIAKLLGDPGLLTRTGMHALTPAYASPEQVLGKPITTATDVYSLGIILYEMLTGRAPYKITETSSPVSIAAAICEGAPAPPGLTRDLDNILLMALRKEPERRYQSVRAFAQDVGNVLALRVVSAREDTLGYRAARFMQRNRLIVAASLAVVLSLTGGIVASQYQARRAERRFNAVRELATEVLVRVDQRLASIPAATEARRELIQIVLKQLQKLALDAEGEAGLDADLATVYHRVGAIQSVLTDAGDPQESLTRAIEFGERARRGGNSDSRILGLLARCYQLLGIRHYELGKIDEARNNFLMGIERSKDPRIKPSGASVEATASRWLGRIESESGEIWKAVAWMQKSVRAAEKSYNENGTPPGVAYEWISGQDYLARTLLLAGDTQQAGAIAAAMVKQGDDLYRANPANSLNMLSRIVGNIAPSYLNAIPPEMLAPLARPEGIDKAIETASRMAAAEPRTNYWRSWLSTAYLQKSFATEDAAKAADAARKALEIVEAQIKDSGKTTIQARRRSLARIQLAECLRRGKNRAGAVEQAELAVRELKEGASDRESKAAIIWASVVLANVDLDGGNKAGAAERLRPARAMAAQLVAGDASDKRMAAFLRMVNAGIARAAGQ